MNEPLAQRMRPKTLAEVCGQQHLLAPGRVFRRTIESGRIPNKNKKLTIPGRPQGRFELCPERGPR